MAGINLKISADDQASGVITGLVRQVHELNSAVKQSEGPLVNLKSAFVGIGAAVGLWKIADYIKDATMMAARYETLGVTMKIVGNNAGFTGAEMLKYEQVLRKTGIAGIEARETLTKMASAHIDLSKSAQLARIAQDAAVIGGINSSEAFERMIRGIQTGETETLRNIGITINMEQAYKKMATQLGKNAQELSETEKIQARTNAVIDKGKDIAGAYAAAMGTAGKQMTSMKRYVDDLKVAVGGVFNDALTVAVNVVTDGFKGLNEEAADLAEKKQIQAWGEDVLMVLAFVADAVAYPIKMLITLGEWLGLMAYRAVAMGSILKSVLSGNFADAKQEYNSMVAAGEDFNKRTEESFANSYQAKAKQYLLDKEAAKGNLAALKEKDEAAAKAGKTRQAEEKAKEDALAAEKKFGENLKQNISNIKEIAKASSDYGKERLALAHDVFAENLKKEFDMLKEGTISVDDLGKSMKSYNDQITSTYAERIRGEQAGMDKLTALYAQFKKVTTGQADAKETKARNLEIVNAIKESGQQIIGTEIEMYKARVAMLSQYEQQVASVLNSKRQELKAMRAEFEDSNKSFEDKHQAATGPILDAYAQRQAAVAKLQEDEQQYDQITDPARREAKLKSLITAYEGLTDEVKIGGNIAITKEQAWNQVAEERKRIQDKLLQNTESQITALEKQHQEIISLMNDYKAKIVELDDLLKNLTRTITIDLKINGMEAIQQIRGAAGSTIGGSAGSAVIASGGVSAPGSARSSGGVNDFSSGYSQYNGYTENSGGAYNSYGNNNNGAAGSYNNQYDTSNYNAGSSSGQFSSGFNNLPNGYMSISSTPSYEVGTNYVPKDGLAYLHEGEAVVPKKFNKQGQDEGGTIQIDALHFNLPNVTNQATARDLARMVIPELRNLMPRFRTT